MPLPENRGFARDIVSYVHEFLGERGIDPEHDHDADLVIEELFTNMVKYGGGESDISIGTASVELC